jgi:tripartite-type tricarboxylate transporter receptor subunit TctC
MRRTVLKAMLAAPCAWAQPAGFPNRSLRMIVPFAAGGAADVVARLMAQGMSEALGQQVVVENRGGANGNLGLEAVARSQPDGYTFGHVNDSVIAINPLLYRNLPFDPARELTPIGIATQGGMFVMVPAELPVRSMAELVALLRARPGELNFCSAGQGSVTHLGYTLFAREAGINMEVVTYRGSAPALQDMLGGRVQLMIDGINLAKAQIDAGRVRALAFIGGTERHPGFPDVPTTTEAGLPGFVMRGW